MSVPGLRAPRAVRRWTALLTLSAAFHVALLGALALRLPEAPRLIGYAPADVNLIAAPPIVRWPAAAADRPTKAQKTRVVQLDTAPRYAATAQAATGDASDAVDLFGPVFADGQWPRPMLVKSEPCDPQDDPDRAAACRRELMLIGLASAPEAGSKAEP